MILDKIGRAARFCAHAHRHRTPDGKPQLRKKTGDPYERHPGRVASMVMLLDGVDGLVIEEEHVAASWLHDVREDTTVTFEEIAAEVGERTAEIVESLTNRYTSKAYPKMNRAARKAEELKRLVEIPRESQAIKICDRMDNLREIDEADDFARVYLRESEDLLLNFQRGLPTLAKEFYREITATGERIRVAEFNASKESDVDEDFRAIARSLETEDCRHVKDLVLELKELRPIKAKLRRVVEVMGQPGYTPVLYEDGGYKAHHSVVRIVRAALENDPEFEHFWREEVKPRV
jgi:hypothetical protein